MTYLNLNNMKEYEEGLKNKCIHPWLVCAFAIVFVILTSLLIYVTWSPKTFEETIKINFEEVPEAHLYQVSGDDEDLNSTNKLSNLTKSTSKNLTALQKYNESSNSDEKVHILDVDPTTTEKSSDELIILIFEDPVIEDSDDWSEKIENSGDSESKTDPNLDKKESPWSLIKKSWYLETQALNITNKNGTLEEVSKILPDLHDFMIVDKIPPLDNLDDPNTSELPDYSSEEEDFFIILPNLEPDYPDMSLADQKVNNPFKEMVKLLQKFMDSQKFSNSNETSVFPNPILDHDDPKIPDDLKDLLNNVPNIIQNPIFGNLLKNLFPENANDDFVLNFEFLGPKEDQMDPMVPKRDPFSKLLNLFKTSGRFFNDDVSENTSEYESSFSDPELPKDKAPWSFDPIYDEGFPQKEHPNPKFVGSESASKATDMETSIQTPKRKFPKKWDQHKEPEVFPEEDQTKSVESGLREFLKSRNGGHLNKMDANKNILASKDITNFENNEEKSSFEDIFDDNGDTSGPRKVDSLESRVVKQDGGSPKKRAALKDAIKDGNIKNNKENSSLKDFFEEVVDSPGVWKGNNRITDPDENFNTYKEENKVVSTTEKRSKKEKKEFINKIEVLSGDTSGNSPEVLFEDYLTTRKGQGANTQKIPVTDEDNYYD